MYHNDRQIRQNGTTSPEDNLPSWFVKTTWRYYSVRRCIPSIRDYIPSDLKLGQATSYRKSWNGNMFVRRKALSTFYTWCKSAPELLILSETITNFVRKFICPRIDTRSTYSSQVTHKCKSDNQPDWLISMSFCVTACSGSSHNEIHSASVYIVLFQGLLQIQCCCYWV